MLGLVILACVPVCAVVVAVCQLLIKTIIIIIIIIIIITFTLVLLSLPSFTRIYIGLRSKLLLQLGQSQVGKCFVLTAMYMIVNVL